ncbi:hypothetical protein F0L17_00130 [Streptomyces sp. TRM43335]|uniref:Uncharacterized protein n=1 Tax=Streptomyces taklimakanensis TaxID=2569853 RepID=A0A6G2B5S4_9ACTN|nr:hypothetical protein [Streptomyces taklimakanensis]MTE17574.1 hypothetical protein [Streptomyces taklimakanensis]
MTSENVTEQDAVESATAVSVKAVDNRLIEEHGADEGCGSVRGTVTVTEPLSSCAGG